MTPGGINWHEMFLGGFRVFRRDAGSLAQLREQGIDDVKSVKRCISGRAAIRARPVSGRGHQRREARTGGKVVVEGFHRDATRAHPIGGAVVFDTNELLKLFPDLRIVRYEDTNAVGDFGLDETRVVRLAAVKPD